MGKREIKLIDGKMVPNRCWYYLLDFNERDNWETIIENFSKDRLRDLNHEEFWKFFKMATEKEIKTDGEYFNLKEKSDIYLSIKGIK